MHLIANIVVDNQRHSIDFENVSGVDEARETAMMIIQSRFKKSARLSTITDHTKKVVLWINHDKKEEIITEEKKSKEQEYKDYLQSLFSAKIR